MRREPGFLRYAKGMHIGDKKFGTLQRFDGQALDLNPSPRSRVRQSTFGPRFERDLMSIT
jgi:hypothetical protein